MVLYTLALGLAGLLMALPASPVARAASLTAGTFAGLQAAINTANASAGVADTITLTSNITLAGPLPAINGDLTIEGDGFSVNGANSHRVFAVTNGNVTFKNLTIAGGRARGGDGGNGGFGGGGGAGMGGGLLVINGIVTIEGVTFRDNAAIGGNGGIPLAGTVAGGGGGGVGSSASNGLASGMGGTGGGGEPFGGTGGAGSNSATSGGNGGPGAGGGGASLTEGSNGGKGDFGGGGAGGNVAATVSPALGAASALVARPVAVAAARVWALAFSSTREGFIYTTAPWLATLRQVAWVTSEARTGRE